MLFYRPHIWKSPWGAFPGPPQKLTPTKLVMFPPITLTLLRHCIGNFISLKMWDKIFFVCVHEAYIARQTAQKHLNIFTYFSLGETRGYSKEIPHFCGEGGRGARKDTTSLWMEWWVLSVHNSFDQLLNLCPYVLPMSSLKYWPYPNTFWSSFWKLDRSVPFLEQPIS